MYFVFLIIWLRCVCFIVICVCWGSYLRSVLLFCSWYLLLGTDCVHLLFFYLSTFSPIFLSFLSSGLILPYLSFQSFFLWVHGCISFSFWEPLANAVSPSLTELPFPKLLRVSIRVSLPCDVPTSDALNSLSSEGDCACLDLLFLIFSISVRRKCCLLERRILIKLKDEISQSWI